jgi:hypothetical protein
MSPSTDRKRFPERFTNLERSHRKVTPMSAFITAAALVSSIDAGKVRLGGYAPTLATADASKVRLGG